MGESLLLALRVALSLAAVLGLLWWLSRRFGSRVNTGRRQVPINVLGRQSLGRHSGLAVIEVGGRSMLVGVSEAGIRLISELDLDLDSTSLDDDLLHLPEDTSDLQTLNKAADASRPASGPLSGSFLSPRTWTQAWAAVQERGRS